MTDSKKVSELPTAANAALADRVVILRDPSGSASVRTITTENLSNSLVARLSINNATVNSAEDVDITNFTTKATTLLLTKQVQGLGTAGVDQDHHYYLTDGSEGQIMYFTAKTGQYTDRIFVWMENMRLSNGSTWTGYWVPFGNGWSRSAAFAIFANGAWNVDSDGYGPL